MIGRVWVDKNRLVTDDKMLAAQFRVPKFINLFVIKDEQKKKRLMANGARVKQAFRDSESKLRCLPPRAFPGAIEKGYIPINWNIPASLKPNIVSRFDISLLANYKGGYQARAIDAMAEYLKTGKGFFIRSGTATGKTNLICGAVDRLKKRTLIVAPRKIINSQLFDELSKYFDNVAIAEGKDIGKNIRAYAQADVLVITHQTLNKHYDFLNGKYDVMIGDEFHQVPASRLEQFAKRKGTAIIGMSANWKRADVAEEDFPKLFGGRHETGQEAAPMKVLLYRYKHTYTIDEYITAGEGYSPDSPEILRRLLINNDDRLESLLSLLKDTQKKFKRIIIFVDRVDYAEKIHKAIAHSYIMTGQYDNNKTKNLLLALDNYVLVAMTQCVREGMNIPNLEFGIMFHSTSELNTIQQVAGRVRRFAEGKQFGYLLDFVDVIKIDDGYGESKSKTLGLYNRKKIYEDLSFEVIEYDEYNKEVPTLFAI